MGNVRLVSPADGRKMFVRVNKVDGVPDDNNGKGGWWTVQDGIPDEGRPGRKGKGKKGRGSAEGVESILGVGDTEREGSEVAQQGGVDRPDSAERVDRASHVDGVNGIPESPSGGEFKWPPAMPMTTAVTANGYGWEKVGSVPLGRPEGAAYVAP